jgi:hypothetical protein
MSRPMLRRIEKLEGSTFGSGPLVLTSARPLPEDPGERAAFIERMKTEGFVSRRGNHVHILAPRLTSQEWAALYCRNNGGIA